jgi:predicted membrane chloride channel (bestrophin family)
MGAKFWDGFKKWGRYMMKQRVFAQEEIGFGRITDSPKEAVELVLRGLPLAVRSRLRNNRN